MGMELVQDLLLNAHKSTWPDKAHPRVSSELANIALSQPSVICQWSWESGDVPVDWKLTNVIQEGQERERK